VIGLGILAMGVAAFTFLPIQETLKRFLEWVHLLGGWGVIWFVLAYILATVFLIPGSILTLGAGAIFGLLWGSIYVSIASTAGASAAFLVGRYLARDLVRKRIEGNQRFLSIDQAMGKEGWKIVGLARLSPVLPFTLLNYAFGLTRVKFSHYVAASWIGMVPGTILYVYLGTLANIGSENRQRTTSEWVFYGIGLAATLGLTVAITRFARRSLDAVTET
jgi:uncharacterized membrane protein YdjX (TVP38/TMEM64 family)